MNHPAHVKSRSGWYRSAASRSFDPLTSATHSMDNSAWSISGRLMAGIGLYAGLGWVISLWIGYRGPLIAIGALIGLVLAYTLIFRGLAHEEQARVRAEGEKPRGR